jgi:NAD(P)-dependent dehydrogenase (short-subunit alcohol dehydrogenase family)
MVRWTIADMPPQAGRLAIVTGANSGIGYETALALASAGARVIVAARSEAKGRTAAQAIGPSAKWRPLDLASLASVEAFADELLNDDARIDVLVLNAGIMAPSKRQTTADGFELQLGVNFLGHFALAARLWPLLADGARIVPLSSIAARRGRLHFDDPMYARRYDPWAAYSQSKLAMLIFGLELARRQDRVASLAAHPGFARTNLIANGMGRNAVRDGAIALFGNWISQSAADGALPVLRAATDPALRSGDFIGSTGPFELRGPAGRAAIPKAAESRTGAGRLWMFAEQATSLRFPV